MVSRRRFSLPLLLLFCCLSCQKKDETGSLILNFQTKVDTQSIEYHSLQYENAAGNIFQVDEVKFFISQVILHSTSGNLVSIVDNDGLHYYDSNLPNTFSWTIQDALPEGLYDSIFFVMGLSPAQNVTGFFVNPPENNMAWPDVLGGGYHYMQINGKWLNINDSLQPFNLHTGLGQVYENGQPTQFVDNSFEVKLSLKNLKIEVAQTAQRTLVMDVNNWFNSPHVYDLNEWGGAIMQNQAAQQTLRENGHDVFAIVEK